MELSGECPMDVGPLLLLNKQEATSTSSQEGVNALKVSEVSLLVQSGVGLEGNGYNYPLERNISDVMQKELVAGCEV